MFFFKYQQNGIYVCQKSKHIHACCKVDKTRVKHIVMRSYDDRNPLHLSAVECRDAFVRLFCAFILVISFHQTSELEAFSYCYTHVNTHRQNNSCFQ